MTHILIIYFPRLCKLRLYDHYQQLVRGTEEARKREEEARKREEEE